MITRHLTLLNRTLTLTAWPWSLRVGHVEPEITASEPAPPIIVEHDNIINRAATSLRRRAEAMTAAIRRVEEEDRVRPLSGMDRAEVVARVKEHPWVYVPGLLMAVAMWLAPYAAAATLGAALGYAHLLRVAP